MSERKNKISNVEKIFFGLGAALLTIALTDRYVYPKLLNDNYQDQTVYSGVISLCAGLGFNSGRQYERNLINGEENK